MSIITGELPYRGCGHLPVPAERGGEHLGGDHLRPPLPRLRVQPQVSCDWSTAGHVTCTLAAEWSASSGTPSPPPGTTAAAPPSTPTRWVSSSPKISR